MLKPWVHITITNGWSSLRQIHLGLWEQSGFIIFNYIILYLIFKSTWLAAKILLNSRIFFSIIYLCRHELRYVYFILWIIIQNYIIVQIVLALATESSLSLPSMFIWFWATSFLIFQTFYFQRINKNNSWKIFRFF